MKPSTLPAFLLFLALSISFSSCSIFDSPEKVAGHYVDIMSDQRTDPAEKADQLYEIISPTDQNYLNKMSNVFVTRDADAWSAYLRKEKNNSTVSQWFVKAVDQGITDTLDFRNMVLQEFISLESLNFSDAEYLETTHRNRPIQRVVFTKGIASNLARSHAVTTFTEDGYSKVILYHRIQRINQQMRKAYKWGKKSGYTSPLVFALNALK